jgi:hypothetical protein
MKERFITLDDLVYWIDLDQYINNKPVYKLARGYYLGSYAIGTCSRCICTGSVMSCVVRHIDSQYVFTEESKALRMLEKMNNESLESARNNS